MLHVSEVIRPVVQRMMRNDGSIDSKRALQECIKAAGVLPEADRPEGINANAVHKVTAQVRKARGLTGTMGNNGRHLPEEKYSVRQLRAAVGFLKECDGSLKVAEGALKAAEELCRS